MPIVLIVLIPTSKIALQLIAKTHFDPEISTPNSQTKISAQECVLLELVVSNWICCQNWRVDISFVSPAPAEKKNTLRSYSGRLTFLVYIAVS